MPGQLIEGGGKSAGDLSLRIGGSAPGDFAGGGASASWETAEATPASPAVLPMSSGPSSNSTFGSSSAGKGGGSSFDGDAVIILIAFGFLLVVILGGGLYLVWQAPVILTEAAFQALLASSLVKASRRISSLEWAESVLRSTWIPFALVLTMARFFAGVAHHYCPQASKLGEVFRDCVLRN